MNPFKSSKSITSDRTTQSSPPFQEKYDQQLREGLLLLVSAPNTEHLFLDDNLKLTFNDSLQRVRWRSKQNLDYAALMEFSTSLSTYYLQVGKGGVQMAAGSWHVCWLIVGVSLSLSVLLLFCLSVSVCLSR